MLVISALGKQRQEISLLYTMSSRSARVTQQDSFYKQTDKPTNKQTTQLLHLNLTREEKHTSASCRAKAKEKHGATTQHEGCTGGPHEDSELAPEPSLSADLVIRPEGNNQGRLRDQGKAYSCNCMPHLPG